MPELLIELLTEEIPARMQARAAEQLAERLAEALKGAGYDDLPADAVRSYVTPRRLVAVVDGLPARTQDRDVVKRGPRVGAPAAALQGFLTANAIDEAALSVETTPKGDFHVLRQQEPGRQTADLVGGLVEQLIWSFDWPKSMRWANNQNRWVRPLRSILCVFDGQPVAHEMAFASANGAPADRIAFCGTTVGHRFHAPAAFPVTGFADYRQKLLEAKVVLDRGDRRQRIREGIDSAAAAAGLSLIEDAGLMEEVCGLVEWPVPLLGSIDPDFMTLPAEVLTTSMRTHQKYFVLRDASEVLAPRFAVVANITALDGGQAIIAGNERVLRARLSDARFFWDKDRQQSLQAYLPALASRVFHARLGSMAERVRRLMRLARYLAPDVGAPAAQAERAAGLAKADLSTGMVGEFPELQGVMGRYYALHGNEAAAIADAIAEHYAPLGPGDRCPTQPVSVAVALADKLDLLAGFFSIDERPTGSKDPFALRRAALGVLRILAENQIRLPLGTVFGVALEGYDCTDPKVTEQLMDFMVDRLKVYLRDRGLRHDLIQAVVSVDGQREDDLVRLTTRAEALSAFLGSDIGSDLLAAYRRAVNILRIEEKRDGTAVIGEPEADLLADPAEQELARKLSEVQLAAGRALEDEDFAGAMTAFGALRQPVDQFFTQVTVNAEPMDLRRNRLRLLAEIRATFSQLADFGAVEGAAV